MLVNPVLIIVSLALIVFLLFYCIINKPKKPVMTLLFIVLLIIFISCTAILNDALTPNLKNVEADNQLQRLLPFITTVKRPTLEQYELSFHHFKVIDICLFVAAIVSMILEIWSILIHPSKSDPQ